jgi:hypothetical protein
MISRMIIFSRMSGNLLVAVMGSAANRRTVSDGILETTEILEITKMHSKGECWTRLVRKHYRDYGLF